MTYDDLEIEARWQRYWDEHGTFRATRRSGRQTGTTQSDANVPRKHDD